MVVLTFWLRRASLPVRSLVYLAIPAAVLPREISFYAVAVALILLFSERLRFPGLRAFSCAAVALPLLLFGWIGEYERQAGLIGVDTLKAVFQTDLREAWGYSSRFFPWKTTLGALALVAAFALFSRAQPKKERDQLAAWRLHAFGVAASILIFLALSNRGTLEYRAHVFTRSVAEFGKEIATQEALARELGAPGGGALAPAKFAGTVVLVIGESTARRHLSLYGYHRPTTPRLDELARRGELLVHLDTISPHTHTVPALSAALNTPKGSLVSLMAQSGFKTFWFSNQNEYGAWDNPIALIGKQAQEHRFIRKSFGIHYRKGSYDEDLLPLYARALGDTHPRKLIVVHLYSTHLHYCEEIPRAALGGLSVEEGLGKKYFGNAKDFSAQVNCYDQSIRYVDGILAKVVERARAESDPTIVGYFADHGENVTDTTGHDWWTHSVEQIEIPQFWYFNSSAKRELAPARAGLAAHLATPFITTDLIPSVLDLVSADASLRDNSRSLFSNSYSPRPRITIPTERGHLAYDDANVRDLKESRETSRARLVSMKARKGDLWKKVWAHRVDSLGKLLDTKGSFSGVELDLVYDETAREFFVYHPPAPNQGLKLEEFLSAVQDQKDLQFWFDWKNADERTFGDSWARFRALDSRFHLRDRSVVETFSDVTAPFAAEISRSGFRHAYYLPTPEVVACAKDPLAGSCPELAKRLRRTALRIGAQAVSFDWNAAPFVRAYRNSAFRGFQFLSWNPELTPSDPDFERRLPEIRDLSVLLVGSPSKFEY